MTELDIYFDTRGTAALDASVKLDFKTVRSCRPDVASIYYAVTRTEEGEIQVEHVMAAVLYELKSSPSRRLVSLADGKPFNTAGQTAIQARLARAQEQVMRQGALYFRTPAGQEQDELMLVAGTGRNLSHTIMRRDGTDVSTDVWVLVGQCLLQEDEEEQLVSETSGKTRKTRGAKLGSAKAKAAKAKTLPLPKATEYDGYQWTPILDVMSVEFLSVLNNFQDRFETSMKDRYPDSFNATVNKP